MRTFLFRLGLLLVTSFGAAAADGKAQALFNGRDLAGWEGDARLWSVSEGVLRGETTLERMTVGNTFLIWRGGVLKDFELTLKVRIRNGNSGVQYRSAELEKKFVVTGYQMEVDNTPGKAGFLYHEKGRKHLALIGEKVEIDASQKPRVVGRIAGREELIAAEYYKAKEWNEYRIVARGPHLQHFVNGRQVVDVLDHVEQGRRLEGILALQIHAGPPMLVEFKDILLQPL